MELFKNTSYDFLRWKWPFIIASLVLSAAGLISLAVKGGPRYGIDFKGGTLMTVKFSGKPPVDNIRSAVSKRVTGEISVQNFESGSNEVAIGTELTDERQLDQNRRAILNTLTATFGQPNSGKLDLNNAGGSELVSRLRDALARNNVAMSDIQLETLAKDILAFRNSPPRSGLITSFDQLSAVPGVTPAVLSTLKQECYLAPFAVRDTQVVGPKVGSELRQRAIWATLAALGGMLIYIAFRFEWIYGVAAVVACFHDTIITIGFFSLFNKEIDLTVIAALLTLVGYSMNDTIVIFDRIRENLKLSRREPLEQLINRSVNQTLSRTIMTSGLTFLTVLALFLFGGQVLHGFSFALVVGILIGTYSSVFVASPIVLFWHNWFDQRKRSAVVVPARVNAVKEPVRKGPVKVVK
ncbi:MAG TPA: protein translocase subunit SecF [Bryobacteraceae bacterium]|nr:protein translocase subunit SecF [Bryobacteraceae bacterium]